MKRGLGGTASDPSIDRNISNPLPTHKHEVWLHSSYLNGTHMPLGYPNICMGLAVVTPDSWDTHGLLGWQQMRYYPRASQVPLYRKPSVGSRAMPFITDFSVTSSQNPFFLAFELDWL